MIPWGTIVSLGGTALSGILSAITNKQSERDAAAREDAKSARAEAYYEAKAAEDPTQTASGRALLNKYDRAAKDQVEKQRAMSVITGATPEQAVATQEAVAQGRSDLMSDMYARSQERADKYNDKADEIRQQHADNAQARADAETARRRQTYANLATNAASALGGIMDSYQASAAKAPAAPAIKESIVTGSAGKAGVAATRNTPVNVVKPGSEVSIEGRTVNGRKVMERVQAPTISLAPTGAVADTSGLKIKPSAYERVKPKKPAPVAVATSTVAPKIVEEEKYRPFEK